MAQNFSNKNIDLEPIAQVVHDAIRAWSAVHGQHAIPRWADAPDWMQASTLRSVAFVLDYPDASAGDQHRQWMAQRLEEGWVFGEVRDEDAKTHPMLVPFEDLPDFEIKKDLLVAAIVKALA